MNPYNEIKKDYFGYGAIAFVCAFVCYFFIGVVFSILVVIGKLIVNYWWTCLILFVLAFIVRRRRKK